MNKKIWLKILSVTLVVIFCLTAVAGCKKDSEDDTDVSDTESVVEGEKDVLEGVRYDGETVNVLSWIPSNLKEYVPEFSVGSHVVEQKTFERMEKTKAQLNINISWKEEKGNAEAMNDFISKAATGIMVSEYDVICCYSSAAASFTSSGYATNLLNYATMDFTQEWYPQNLVEDCTMFDKLYFCTGDISTNLIYMTSLVFFNNKLMNDYHINDMIKSEYGEDDIYALVREGKWTQEALITLSSAVGEDTDNSGSVTATEGDTVGFSTYETLLTNFYQGAGYKTIDVSETGVAVSEDYMDADIVGDLLETFVSFLYETPNAFYCGGGNTGHSSAAKMFADGRSLFSLAPASHAYKTHAQSGVKFGALPVPKGSNDQEKYLSVHSRPYSMFFIPNTSNQKDIAASFIHCLGQHSYETTRKAIIDTTMKGRYASIEAADLEMWDYIIDSQTFDMGRIFEKMFIHKGGNGDFALTDMFAHNRLAIKKTEWASISTNYRAKMENQCTDINNMLQSFGDQ